MSSNSLVFHTFGGISSSPAAFLFLIFLCTKPFSYCVKCHSFMSCWLLLIFMIGLSETFGGFSSEFSKCYFHRCIHSSCLAAFTLALPVLFLLLPFTVSHAILDFFLSSTEFLLLLIWFFMYSVCSFRSTLVHFVPSCVSEHWYWLGSYCYIRMLGLALCLIDMHSIADEVLIFFIRRRCFWYLLNCIEFVFSVNVYLSLISLLLNRNQL